MTLMVIGAGFGRTGTLSLKHALELLGYGPCYHMFELNNRMEHLELWHRAMDDALASWDAIFRDYNSAVDWPTCSFWRQLSVAYPDAKFVLTEREPDAWYRSASSTIFPAMIEGRSSADPNRHARIRMSSRLILSRTFDDRTDDKAHTLDVYSSHVREVKAALPHDRLLVMNVEQGWRPLCDFLGCPVPEVDFPHLNDGARDFKRRMARGPETA
jgi:hypothetical protein